MRGKLCRALFKYDLHQWRNPIEIPAKCELYRWVILFFQFPRRIYPLGMDVIRAIKKLRCSPSFQILNKADPPNSHRKLISLFLLWYFNRIWIILQSSEVQKCGMNRKDLWMIWFSLQTFSMWGCRADIVPKFENRACKRSSWIFSINLTNGFDSYHWLNRAYMPYPITKANDSFKTGHAHHSCALS